MLFIMLYKVILTFESVNEILTCDQLTIQMKATDQYFSVVLFIMLCKVVLSSIPSCPRFFWEYYENLI